jgi:peptidoglycan/LPS O-acetylase OafA/YrhL
VGLYRLNGRQPDKVARSLPPLLWLIFVASLAYCLWLSYHETPRAFYLMPTRAWEFAAGALLAITPCRLAGNRMLAWPVVSACCCCWARCWA